MRPYLERRGSSSISRSFAVETLTWWYIFHWYQLAVAAWNHRSSRSPHNTACIQPNICYQCDQVQQREDADEFMWLDAQVLLGWGSTRVRGPRAVKPPCTRGKTRSLTKMSSTRKRDAVRISLANSYKICTQPSPIAYWKNLSSCRRYHRANSRSGFKFLTPIWPRF